MEMMQLECDYEYFSVWSTYTFATHVMKWHESENWGTERALPKEYKSANDRSCSKALLSDLNQLPGDRVTAARAKGEK